MRKVIEHIKKGARFLNLAEIARRLIEIIKGLSSLEEKISGINVHISEFESNLDVIRKIKANYNEIRKIPGILLNTMPKSGSTYILSTIGKSLNIDILYETISPGCFPTYTLLPDKLKCFMHCSAVTGGHFDASALNLRVLNTYKPKLILHVRDPRQATLSWAHHVNKLLVDTQNADHYMLHAPPEDYLNWSLNQQIDWQIETHFKSLVCWLQGWVNAIEHAKFDILLTNHEEMCQDELAFFHKIVDFYGIDRRFFKYDPPNLTQQVHFRKGETAEWEHIFTDTQKRRCEELLGDALLERFSWKKTHHVECEVA